METTSGPQRKKKQDGEMDDETCMKGFWDFIIHVTYNQRVPEADPFLILVAHLVKYPGPQRQSSF